LSSFTYMKHLAVAFALAALADVPALAGQSTPPLRRGDRFVNTSGGISFATTGGPRMALVRDRSVFMSAVQAEWIAWSDSNFAFSWTAELVPIALIVPPRNAPESYCWLRVATQQLECYAVDGPHRPVAAAGVTPVGFRAYMGPDNQVRAFAAAAAGGMVFDRNTPVSAARAVNFAVEFSLGAEVAVGDGALVAAWKFHHWSNANTARLNPGLDANLLYFGLKRKR
jgi:hypothetical protein